MGKISSSIIAILALGCLLGSGILLDSQKPYIMEPFEEYLQFNKYIRDVNDLNYFIHGYLLYNKQDRIQTIEKQLSDNNSTLTRKNIIDYYIEKIKNSVNHQDIEDLFKMERFSSLFLELDQQKIINIFNKMNYNSNHNETNEFSISSEKLYNLTDTTIFQQLNNADKHAFNQFIEEIQSKSLQIWIVILLITGVSFVLIFQCTFLPITYEIYKERNKKSRRKEARMSKNTLYMHQVLHFISIIFIIGFIINFNLTQSDLYDKTNKSSFDFLKYTNNYYHSLRIFQANDLRNIYEANPVQNENSSNNNTQINIDTIYKREFQDALKQLQNNYKFSIKFNELKNIYMRYVFNVDCKIQIIQENIQSTILCKKYEKDIQRLKLNYSVKTQYNNIDNVQYHTIYDESMIYDHFQIEYCHDITRNIQEVMEEYILSVEENVMLFYFQIASCIAFLFIFWIPFFKDKEKFKKDAKRFEMVNEL